MPTYIVKTTASDLSPTWPNTTEFDNEMSTGTGTDTSINITMTAGVDQSASFITPAGVPNNDAWENGGTYTVEVEVDTANSSITFDCRIVKLSSTGTLIEGGSFVGTQDLGASRTFSPVAPTWTGSEACGNRLAIEIALVAGGHGPQAADIGVGTAANEVITVNLTENSAGCAAGAVITPIIVNESCLF